jgi:hypothetical protein
MFQTVVMNFSLIFPNKIHFENKKVRTADINPILNEITSINKAFGGAKNETSLKKNRLVL